MDPDTDFADTDTSETECQADNVPNAEQKRGVKRGTKRGAYKRTGEEKTRVLAAYDGAGDWRAVATANGVSIGTAYGWIRRASSPVKPRGGARFHKVTENDVEKLLSYLKENPQLTLKELARKLRDDTGVSVSTTTVHKHLNGRLFTCKRVRAEPAPMNAEENRRKRAAYVTSVMEALGQGKTVVYMDESNVNLFIRRGCGRSRKGTRCSVKAPASKGHNVHIIGAISQTGMVYWERRRGSFRKEDCKNWVRCMLRASQCPMGRLVLVCDNAPCHSGLEEVFEEDEFRGAVLLRMGPYSAPLNPIEEVWSVVMADIKRRMSSSMANLLRPTPSDITQGEHRMRHLEGAIDAAMPAVTPMLCLSTCNHVQRHFAACLALSHLGMGDNVLQSRP